MGLADDVRRIDARYRDLINCSFDVVWRMGVDGVFTFVSPAVTAVLGYEPQELVGRSYERVLNEDSAREVNEYIDRRQLEGPNGEDTVLSLTHRRKDGTEFIGEMSAALITDADGEAVEIQGVTRDTTERKAAEEEKTRLEAQLRQSQKMESIGRLAGGVAHDFNNLLSAILGYADLVLADLHSGDPLYPMVKEIRQAGDRARSLTHQLLAFSRRQVLEMRVLNLNDVVRDMERMLHRIIGENIELTTLLDPDVAHVKADPSQIQQVLMNLAVNARDAIPDFGRLSITTRNVVLEEADVRPWSSLKPGGYVLLCVADTGQGIPAETLQHIFEPFFTTKEKGQGTGLGLSTVHGIIRQHGGDIAVQSEPGRGATFRVYLPRASESVQEGPSEAAGHGGARGHEAILVVEDEPTVRFLAGQILRRHGYEVLEAESAEDALRLIEEEGVAVDLLLSDVVLPQMSGPELYERSAALRPGLRVLYMTGYTDRAIGEDGTLHQRGALIRKPISVASLTEKIREVLDA